VSADVAPATPPKALNQAKNGKNILKMRVFYEHFSRNDRNNIPCAPKIRSCFLSEFSIDDSTCFFLLSLVIFFPFSSERKRERK
jgi:hypothetical protein